MSTHTTLIDTVGGLRARLEGVALALDVPGAGEARRARDELVGQIDDYLLPRLRSIDAPLVVVVGGSTGAGKSTILNSLVGRVVSPAGVLRPTTTTPVLVANPHDIEWFSTDRILPELPRLTGSLHRGAKGLYLVQDADVPRGLALLDAPDIDSIVITNRQLGVQLLAAADLWLFVTTAARYADAVPWEFLRRARERSTSIALLLNRVPEEARDDVPAHFADLLSREGLGEAPVLTIPEATLENGLISEDYLDGVRRWLNALGADAQARAAVVKQTLEGALGSIGDRVEIVAGAIEQQIAAADSLAAEATAAYAAALTEIEQGLSGGPLLRAEVLARWYEFIGTGDVMRQIQSAIGRTRDRIMDALLGRPPVEQEVSSAVEQSIEVLVESSCDKAADRLVVAWRATNAGRGLLAEVPPRSSKEFRALLDQEVRAWQGRVLELVAAQGATKRVAGRAISFGVNAVGAALMITAFAHTGGLTGGEVAIAGGAAAVSQRLLEALFGDQAVRDLTATARTDLLDRLEDIVRAEAARYEVTARRAADDPREIDALRGVASQIRGITK
jgi:hypothetical protein